SRMRRALDEYRIEGVRTTIPFHRRVVRHPAFLAGDLDTSFIETYRGDLIGGASGEQREPSPRPQPDVSGKDRVFIEQRAPGFERQSSSANDKAPSVREVAVIAAAIAAYWRLEGGNGMSGGEGVRGGEGARTGEHGARGR